MRIFSAIFVPFAIALLGCIAFPSATYAGNFIVPTETINVVEGATFTVPVTINPTDDKSYTVRFALDYPPEMLEVTSFTFAPNWLAVPQPRYDLIDNVGGHLVKTAGFPGGFSDLQSFGIVTFRAKKSGTAAVAVGAQSFILNAKNTSTLESRPQMQIVITEVFVPEVSRPVAVPLPSLPVEKENLFDIGITPQVETSGAGLISMVAPGEILPVSVRLLNLGNANRVDVIVSYEIVDIQGNVISKTQDTVAVETTANFVKTVQIPYDAPPGRYVVRSSITYEDQLTPATTEFPFTVERKYFGIFQSSFILYVSATLLVSLGFCLLLLLFVLRRRREAQTARFDYSNIPYEKRVFFELLSDTIADMRQRAGDDALEVAKRINGLVIDEETGRVLEITRSPSKVIAELVAAYEKTLHKNVSFLFRKD